MTPGWLEEAHTVEELSVEFTDAATMELETHLSSIKKRVLQEISASRQKRDYNGVVRSEEVTAAIKRLAMLDARGHYTGRIRRLVRVGLPLLALLIQILLLASLTLNPEFRLNEPASIISAFVISMITIAHAALFIGFLAKLRRQRDGRRAIQNDYFLRRIAQLEAAGRRYALTVAGSIAAQGSLSVVLDSLVGGGVWTSEDVNKFRVLLKLRNLLVHEQSVGPNFSDDMPAVLGEIDRLEDLVVRAVVKGRREGKGGRIVSNRFSQRENV